MRSKKTNLGFLTIAFSFLCLSVFAAPANIFWIGGSGNWEDINNWSVSSGGVVLATSIPTGDITAIIDENSGLSNTSTILIPSGDFAVKSLIITNEKSFTIQFDGTNSNNAKMSVHEHLQLGQFHSIIYTETFGLSNEWKFVSSSEHDITTYGQNLQNIEFSTEDAVYNQQTDIEVQGTIHYDGGTWNTNNNKITCNKIIFYNGNGQFNQLTKLMNAGTSEITCEEWNSKLTYGSLIVTGGHHIITAEFKGSPAQDNTIFKYNKITLMPYPDYPSNGSSSQVDHNNFECTGCIINHLIIDDTGHTKLAGKFTIETSMVVKRQNARILFNDSNTRTNDVTINGSIQTPPIGECGQSTYFSNIYGDHTVFIRNSGSLSLESSIVNNIKTQGNANFKIYDGVLQGNSQGWHVLSNPEAKEFQWKGPTDGTYGDWNDTNNWIVNGNEGLECYPTLFDNVSILYNGTYKIRIPEDFTAQCKSINWTNTGSSELILDGSNSSLSQLLIAKDFSIDPTAIINTDGQYRFIFSGNEPATIRTNSVELPNLQFTGNKAKWLLQDNLSCGDVRFRGGTMDTKGYNITADFWVSYESNPKTLILNESTISIAGEFSLSSNILFNVTVHPGTSLIKCDNLISTVADLYDISFHNTSARTLNSTPFNFNTLTLNGTGSLLITENITVNNLVLAVNSSKLQMEANKTLTVNETITSMATESSPAYLESSVNGTMANLNKAEGNLCIVGPIEIRDMNSVITKVIHAPSSTDAGNNLGINFTNTYPTTDLYWIAGTGTWQVKPNWSRISGGCPASNDPQFASTLYFDNNSFLSSDDVITVPFSSTCTDIVFENSASFPSITVQGALKPNSITVNAGISITGNKMLLSGPTIINTGGFLSTDLTLYRTDSINSSGGTLLVKTGSLFQILD